MDQSRGASIPGTLVVALALLLSGVLSVGTAWADPGATAPPSEVPAHYDHHDDDYDDHHDEDDDDGNDHHPEGYDDDDDHDGLDLEELLEDLSDVLEEVGDLVFEVAELVEDLL